MPKETFHFDVVVKDESELTVALADAVFEAGCDDCTPSSRDGVVKLGFSREAASYDDAVASAKADMQKAGYEAADVTKVNF